MLPRWATLALAITTGGVWAGNTILGMIDPARATSPYVHAIFMAVIGAVFGLDQYKRRDGGTPTPPALPEPPPPGGVIETDRGEQ